MIFDVSVITCPLTHDRRDRWGAIMSELQARHDVTWRFISEADPESVTPELLARTCDVKPVNDPRLAPLNKFSRFLTPRHVSNALNHRAALGIAASRPPGVVCLVLEDDAVPADGWVGKLEAVVSSRPDGNAGIAFTGILPGEEFGWAKVGPADVAPMCDSYIVTPAAAAALHDAFLPLRFPTPIHLCFLSLSSRLPLSHTSPSVFRDGSKTGHFVGKVDAGACGRIILNDTFVEANRSLQGSCTADDAARIDALASSSRFRDHPDIMHVVALARHRSGGAALSHTVFAAAIDTALRAGAPIGPESALLRDFISSHAPARATKGGRGECAVESYDRDEQRVQPPVGL